jgi:outer membrane receptor protein involved in Fe transport
MVSRHQIVAGLTVTAPRWGDVTLLVRYLSRQFADDLNTQPIADFVVVDASFKKQIGRALRLFLDVENLTDRSYIATQTGVIKTLGIPLLVLGGVTVEY